MEITNEEKKQVKADIARLQKLILKAKPERMTMSDVAAVSGAIANLRSSSANACRTAGINREN